MDQGYVVSTTSAGHYVRLALIFFASVFGLILLGFAFGSSSASADDGGPDDGGLIPVTIPVAASIPFDVHVSPATTTVATVTHVAPVVGDVLGSTPAGLTVGTLAKTVDATIGTAVGTLTAAVAPVLHLLPVFASAPATAAAVASMVSAADVAISRAAHGLWPGAPGPFGMGAIGVSGPSLTSFTLPAAALGTGFLVLLFSRRLSPVNSALPVSPVYETDTSPD